jgi:hypothetical protein
LRTAGSCDYVHILVFWAFTIFFGDDTRHGLARQLMVDRVTRGVGIRFRQHGGSGEMMVFGLQNAGGGVRIAVKAEATILTGCGL